MKITQRRLTLNISLAREDKKSLISTLSGLITPDNLHSEKRIEVLRRLKPSQVEELRLFLRFLFTLFCEDRHRKTVLYQ